MLIIFFGLNLQSWSVETRSTDKLIKTFVDIFFVRFILEIYCNISQVLNSHLQTRHEVIQIFLIII